MLRIPRAELDKAVEAVMIAARVATNVMGQHVVFNPDQRTVEAAVLGALSIIAPHGGPCTAADVQFVGGFGTKDAWSFPPDTKYKEMPE